MFFVGIRRIIVRNYISLSDFNVFLSSTLVRLYEVKNGRSPDNFKQ